MIDVLIPVKGSSQRVPNKNFRMLAGRQLYKYILDVLSKSKYVGEIYIDTNVRERFDLSDYKSVHLIERPKELIGHSVSVNDLIKHDMSITKADTILQTHITNPFLTTETINSAIEKFQNENIDSMFGVTAYHSRFWDASNLPINHEPDELIQSQELSPVYEDNSCIYLFKRSFFEKYNMRMNGKSKMFEINSMEALDIDTEFDWRIAECMIRL